MDNQRGVFEVKRALIKVNGELYERSFILKDKLPFNEANFFIDDKSSRSVNTGRQYAYCLRRYLNYLSIRNKSYKEATSADVIKFLDNIIFNSEQDVVDIKSAITYNTVNEYVIATKGFYLSVDSTSDKKMFEDITQYNYGKFIDDRIRVLKDSKEKIKWLNEKQIHAIADSFNFLRDKAIFLIMVFCGCRIGEAISILHQDYQRSRKTGKNTVSPYHSKGVLDGEGRDIFLPESICGIIDSYIMTERNPAQQLSGEYFCPELFITLQKGKHQGAALTYLAYYGIFKRTVKKAGLDPALFTTHDGRRTKVMALLKYQSETGLITDEQIRMILGWRDPSSINPYKNIKDNEYIKSIAKKIPGFAEMDLRDEEE